MSTDVEAWLEKDTLASNVSRGLISGVLGGLAGTLIKVAIERVLPVRKPNTKSAQLKMVDELSVKVSGEPISSSNKELAEQLVNFPFGASIGATYGYGKRDEMETSLFDGAMLGATTWVATHETSLPMLGLKEEPEDIPMKLQANELIAHVAFGLTTELVRAFVARRLRE
jgi:putative membrane protein